MSPRISAIRAIGATFAMVLLASAASAAPGSERIGPRVGYAPIDGLEMYYEVHEPADEAAAADGTPLLLLHGAYTTIDIAFGGLIPTLAERRPVIAVEQQGHGHTADVDRPLSYEQMADDAAALLRHLGVEPVDVLGYSMGANVALQLAVRHPDLVRKLVVVSAYLNSYGLYPGVLEGIGQVTPDVFTGSGLPESYAAVAPDPTGWPALVEKVKDLDLGFRGWPAAVIGTIAAPTLVVAGDSDIVRTSHAAELFELLGGGVDGDVEGLPEDQLAILPGTTHLGIVLGQADLLATMVADFLDGRTA